MYVAAISDRYLFYVREIENVENGVIYCLEIQPQLSLKTILNFLIHLSFTLERRPSYSCKSHGQSRAIFAWQLLQLPF